MHRSTRSFSPAKTFSYHRSTYTFNTAIRAHLNSPYPEKALTHFTHLKQQSLLPDNFTLPSLIKLCYTLNQPSLHAQHFHSFTIKTAYLHDIFVGTSLAEMYFQYGMLASSSHLFDEIPQRDVVLWTAMVAGFSRNGVLSKALEFLSRMWSEGIKPNGVTLSSVLSACSKAMRGSVGKVVHGFSIRNDISVNDMVYETSLVDMYVKCRNLSYGVRVFDRMEERNLVSWNAVIAGYADNGLNEEVFKVFREMMLRNREKPRSCTLASVLQVCGGSADLLHGRELHGHIVRRGCGSTLDRLVENNSFIDMYAKGGDLDSAVKIFKSVTNKNLVTWTTMIMGYGTHGLGKEALRAFGEMKNSGIGPDSVTFIALLSACSHGRLVEEGQQLYISMQRDYGIDPDIKHFACMVDLYGRAGHLERAYSFIQSMPVEPTEFIWSALLSSCRLYKNVDLGEKAARKALALNKYNVGIYILLSRLYAESGHWEDLSKVRLDMKNVGLKPVTAESWVSMERKLYTFRVKDRWNSYSDKIYGLLDTIKKRMQMVGYISNRTNVGHNINEEEKESDICGHTEMLALAFVLIKGGGQGLIRIGKNLRVCRDCHETFKCISEVTAREIILKDPNRYHKFRHGHCSCCDFW